MTVCRFYANGYCRYGNNCRFQHISDHHSANDSYYQNTHYNRTDGHRQSQPPMANTSNRVGFSFNKTLDTLTTSNTAPAFGQRFQSSGQSAANYRPNETQNSMFGRNMFQFPNNNNVNTSMVTTQRPTTFSFNRTLQQISSGDAVVVVNDMDMESMASQPSRPNSALHETQSTGFAVHKQLITHKSEPIRTPTVNPNINTQTSDDTYSKESHLTQQDIQQYQSNTFTYKMIPILPPTRQLIV